MGYFKNLEIEGQVEEPDRVVGERRRRRETYQRPKTIVVDRRDWVLLWSMTSIGWVVVFGLSVGLAVTL